LDAKCRCTVPGPTPACRAISSSGTPRPSRSEAQRIVGEFLDAGGNLIDTADIYNGGTSEEIVGRAIASRRDEVVLATKGGGPRGRGPNTMGLSRVQLTRALEASLRRLGTDHVDLYQCHVWDEATPTEETMSALDEFVRSGKVRYLGCSNFTVAQIIESQWAAQRLGGSGFVSLQPHYSLLARDIEAEILPACDRLGLGAIMTERNFSIVDAVANVAAELDTTPAAAAISWVSRRPGVSSVILGPRSHDQLRTSLAGLDLQLPTPQREHLDAASTPANRPVTGVPIEMSATA
jgi:aryl-alcohol dehydrogenase-like predicted oxidoreductase